MNVSIKEINSIKRELTVELPEETALKSRKKHLDKFTREARLKGFRPGKAPRNLVAQIYADELKTAVLEEVVSQAMPQLLTEHKLEPVGQPTLETLDYVEGGPYKFTVTLEIPPVFEAPEWRGLEIQRLKANVTEEMIDQKIGELRRSLSTVKKVEEERPLQTGDLANITYQGYQGENLVTDLSAGPLNVELGTDRLTPEFEQGLLGMKAGETRDISVVMPEGSRKELAGQTLVLRTTLKEISRRELPELDDEMAKDLSIDGVETLATLRERIRVDSSRALEAQNDQSAAQQVSQILARLVKIDLPTALVEREIYKNVEEMRRNFGQNGLDFKKMGLDVNMLHHRLRPQAEVNVTAALVLDRIARDNNIETTEEDISQALADMSREYHRPAEALREHYQSKGLMESLRAGLRMDKTIDLIRAEAKVEEVDHIDPARLGRGHPITGPEDETAETAEAPPNE
ncbi:MAG: trigger factor [Candidatus Adiutrix sp.]|jgi:trigger factor|nr:trigger factor [Candidatus Adiutrix sp.]